MGISNIRLTENGMDLVEAKAEFRGLLAKIRVECFDDFIAWIKENADVENSEIAEGWEKSSQDKILASICEDVRQSIPVDAMSPSEKICFPTGGPNSDCDPKNTVHVDAFLYDEDAIDYLCEQGKLSRNYCTHCGAQDVQPLKFITHSASVSRIKFIFQYLLPQLGNKIVLDVGSRTGAILYGAYLYTNAHQIVGVEIDASFCELQQRIVEKYGFVDRIQIIHSDIVNQEQLLQCSDVIILNNVFEFFMPNDAQERLWCFLSQHIRKSGAILITIPSIEESLQHLKTQIDVTSWVQPVDCSEKVSLARKRLLHRDDGDVLELEGVFMYQIL